MQIKEICFVIEYKSYLFYILLARNFLKCKKNILKVYKTVFLIHLHSLYVCKMDEKGIDPPKMTGLVGQ